MPIRVRLGTLGLAVLLGISTMQAPAAAHSGAPPWHEWLSCQGSDGYVEVCFELDGDDFWVKDNEKDSASANVTWWTNNRGGSCTNSHGYGTWHECTYDLPENETVWWDQYTYNKSTGKWTWRSGTYMSSTSS